MDDFENELARMMREASNGPARFDPARRERLRAGVRTRRRNRYAWAAGGTVLAAALAGVALLGLPDSGTTSVAPPAAASPSASAPGLLTVPKGADTDTRNAYLEQNAIAVCMRARGFTYTPHVVRTKELYSAVDGEDYEKAEKFRSKYGYSLYWGAVNPDDPHAPGNAEGQAGDNPDAAYLASLSPSRKAAYEKALGSYAPHPGLSESAGTSTGCAASAHRQIEGSELSDAEKKHEIQAWNAQVAKEEHVKEQLDHNPELLALASSYAACLKSHHIKVTTANPSDIGDMVKRQESDALPAGGTARMSKRTAQEALQADIAVSLVDLDCGKDFRAAYFAELKRLS